MSEHTTSEVLTGAGVLAIAAGFLFYMSQVGGVGLAPSGTSTYTASFRSAEGVGVGTDVRIAGVKVGSILGMELDKTTFRAETVMGIDDEVALPEDTAVVISSEGLLGGSFVELLPGGSVFNLEPGAEIEDTQSSVSIIELLLKFVSGDQE